MAPRGFLFAALVALVASASTSGCDGDVCPAGEVGAKVPDTSFDDRRSLLQKTAELRAIDKAMYQTKDNEKNEEISEEGEDHPQRDDLPKSSEDKKAAELRAIEKQKKKLVAMYQAKDNAKNEEEDEQPDDLPKSSEDMTPADNDEVGGESYTPAPDDHGYADKAHTEEGDVPEEEFPGHPGHDNTSLLETGAASGCSDNPAGWYDSDGPYFDCDWYASTSGACQNYGGGYARIGYTAKTACCACGGGDSTQQYYAFSHRTLTTTDIWRALADGANAIEIDVVAWWNECNQHDWRTAGCWWSQHDGLCNVGGGDLDCTGGRSASGDRLDVMLNYIKNNGNGKVAAVMIDIKNPDWCDPGYYYYKQCSVKMLKELAVNILGDRVNVVYDVYGQFSGVGYRWLQGNYRSCLDSTDAELFTAGASFPSGMAKTYTYGGSFSGDIWGWCNPLEQWFLSQRARVAAFWTTTSASQVVTGCGNAIILGHTLYHYNFGGSSFKSVVDKAKQVASARGFEWPTSATSWCT